MKDLTFSFRKSWWEFGLARSPLKDGDGRLSPPPWWCVWGSLWWLQWCVQFPPCPIITTWGFESPPIPSYVSISLTELMRFFCFAVSDAEVVFIKWSLNLFDNSMQVQTSNYTINIVIHHLRIYIPWNPKEINAWLCLSRGTKLHKMR